MQASKSGTTALSGSSPGTLSFRLRSLMNYPNKNAQGQYRLFIDGHWRDSKSSVSYENRNPAHKDEIFGYTMDCLPEEVDEAMQAAERAFDEWRQVSGDIKTKLFLKVAQILHRNHDRVIQSITCEMGKTHFDAGLDLNEAIGVVELVAPMGLSL